MRKFSLWCRRSFVSIRVCGRERGHALKRMDPCRDWLKGRRVGGRLWCFYIDSCLYR